MKNWSKRLLQIIQNAAKEERKKRQERHSKMGYLVFTWKTHHPIFSGGKSPQKRSKYTKTKNNMILIAQHKMCAHFEGKSIFQTIYTAKYIPNENKSRKKLAQTPP